MPTAPSAGSSPAPIVALLIDPAVDLVDRVMPRWLAVIVVLIGLDRAHRRCGGRSGQRPGGSLEELSESAPQAAADLEEQHDVLADIDLATRVQDFVDELDDRVRRDAVSTATATFPPYIVTGILMLFLLAYGKRYFDGFVEQLPDSRQAGVRTVGRQAALRGRRYLLIVLAHSVVNGVVVGTLCWWIGLPAAIALGFAVGVLTAIPLIGILVGGIPAVLLAFGVEDWRAGSSSSACSSPCSWSRPPSCGPTSTTAPCASGRLSPSSSPCSGSSCTASVAPSTAWRSPSSPSPRSTPSAGSARQDA